MDQIGEVITHDNHTDIYEWLSKYVIDYEDEQTHYTLTSEGKINVYDDLYLKNHITEIKYTFGYVKGDFNCTGCKILTSLINFPKEVGGRFYFYNCIKLTSLVGFPKEIGGVIYLSDNNFSNDPSVKHKYKLYLAMWLELLESVNNKERKEYITNYKNIKAYENPIIPIEILKEYGF